MISPHVPVEQEPSLNWAMGHLLEPAALDSRQLVSTMEGLLGPQVDYADIYLQSIRHESWMLEEGLVKEGTYHHSRGMGLRAVSGEKTGFAYVDSIDLPSLQKASQAAKSIGLKPSSPSLKLSSPSLSRGSSARSPCESSSTALTVPITKLLLKS